MVIGVGDILFTSFLTDDDGTIDVSFSFVATTAIAAGEVITFHHPESTGDAFFTYTVGPGGLSADDFVRISVPNGTGTPSLIGADPSGASVLGALQGISWDVSGSDNIIASSGTTAISAISARDGFSALDNSGFMSGGVTTTALLAASGDVPNPVIELNLPNTVDNDNVIWQGGPYSGINNSGNWSALDILPTGGHSSPDFGGTTYATQESATPCFAPGTMIATETGEAAVETLKIGDMVRTAAGKLVPVVWIGRHTAAKKFAGKRMEPVRFAAGSLGAGLPHSDLIVTQDHGMVIDGLVINASALVNGSDIDFIALDALPERVVYYHVETETHDVILANGTTSETYVDIPNRKVFDNYAEYLALYGEEHRVGEMTAKRITSQRLLPNALRSRLGITAPAPVDLLATG